MNSKYNEIGENIIFNNYRNFKRRYPSNSFQNCDSNLNPSNENNDKLIAIDFGGKSAIHQTLDNIQSNSLLQNDRGSFKVNSNSIPVISKIDYLNKDFFYSEKEHKTGNISFDGQINKEKIEANDSLNERITDKMSIEHMKRSESSKEEFNDIKFLSPEMEMDEIVKKINTKLSPFIIRYIQIYSFMIMIFLSITISIFYKFFQSNLINNEKLIKSSSFSWNIRTAFAGIIYSSQVTYFMNYKDSNMIDLSFRK